MFVHVCGEVCRFVCVCTCKCMRVCGKVCMSACVCVGRCACSGDCHYKSKASLWRFLVILFSSSVPALKNLSTLQNDEVSAFPHLFFRKATP